MNFMMTKIAAGLVLAVMAGAAQADAVTSMTLGDTINANGTATLSDDVLGSDGFSGAFRFGSISLGAYTGASTFSGNLNSGVIDIAGGAPLDFTTGFVFAGSDFQPFNVGAITANIDTTGGVNGIIDAADLTFSNFEWAGFFVNANFTFQLSPLTYSPAQLDEETFLPLPGATPANSLVVNNLIATGTPGEYAYRMSWNHVITGMEDPSGQYAGQNARWVIEGTIAAVPEASTYGMMLAGLGLVGFAVRRRKLMA